MAIVGPIPNSHLARVDLCDLSSEWAVRATGVVEVASNGQDVIVSGTHPSRPGGPPSGVQRLSQLIGNSFEPIPGLAEGREFSPAVSESGDVIFASPKGDGRYLLMRYSKERASVSTIYEVLKPMRASDPQAIRSPAASRHGLVGAVRRNPKAGRFDLLILESDGTGVSEYELPFGGEMAWSNGPVIAISPGSDSWRTALVDPDSGEVQVVEGWRSLDWSPDGELLLYQREDSVLGVAKAATPTDIEPIGKLKDGTVYDAAWIE